MIGRRRVVQGVGVLVAGLGASASPRAAAAAAAPAELGPLLARLADHGDRFERMKTHANFTVRGHLEKLDRAGGVDETRDMTVRVTAPRPPAHEADTEILAYTVDGRDERAEAVKKSAERKAKRARERAEGKDDKSARDKRDFHLPFLASEQPRYVFTLLERHPSRPELVRVGFAPKVPAEDAYKGSAWVHEADGEPESLGLSLSKNPTFVDRVEATVVFGLRTPLGRAPSKLTFEATGGFLSIIKRRYRGSAVIEAAQIQP